MCTLRGVEIVLMGYVAGGVSLEIGRAKGLVMLVKILIKPSMFILLLVRYILWESRRPQGWKILVLMVI